MIDDEADDDADVPDAFVARAVNVYAVPFDKLLTTQDASGTVTVQVDPPGEATTEYVSGAPPEPDAAIVTTARPSPATATG